LDHLERTKAGIEKAKAETTDPEKKAMLEKSEEGIDKKIEKITKKTVTEGSKVVEGIRRDIREEPMRRQQAIQAERQKIQMLREQEALDQMKQKRTGGSMGTSLGQGAVPSIFGSASTEKNRFVREKVTTFVRGKPVVTERWVPVKDQQSRRGIPQDRAELYRSELNQERVFEPTPPFGGNNPQVSQSVPFTGNFGIMQQQQQVPIVRRRPMAKQKPQPAPFSQPMGIIQRQPRPTRVVGGRRPQARSDGRNVIININQTPFGATKVMPRGNVQVRRPVPKQEAKPQKQAPMPFGGFAPTKKDKKFRII